MSGHVKPLSYRQRKSNYLTANGGRPLTARQLRQLRRMETRSLHRKGK